MVYYLILCNESSTVVCMKAGNILSKCFLGNWVAVDFGCTGTLLILSVDYQFGAPLHTAHTVLTLKAYMPACFSSTHTSVSDPSFPTSVE